MMVFLTGWGLQEDFHAIPTFQYPFNEDLQVLGLKRTYCLN